MPSAIQLIQSADDFPNPLQLDPAWEGIAGVSTELDPDLIPEAYRRGFFPWYSENDPVIWWFTSPRMVLKTSDLTVSHSLLKRLKDAASGFIERTASA